MPVQEKQCDKYMRYMSACGNGDEVDAYTDMFTGQMGVITRCPRSPEFVGHLVLRVYNRLVSLDNPQNTWMLGYDIKVRLLPRTSAVTLVVR